MSGCDNICTNLDNVLDEAHSRIEHEHYAQTLDITLFALLTATELAKEVDSSSGSLSWTIDTAMEKVELMANSLVQYVPCDEFVGKTLKTAEDSVFDGWDHWRYGLLRRTAGHRK